MPIENLKRWHWIMISLVVGLAGAWIMLAMGPRPSTQGRTIGPQGFEAAALRAPTMGFMDPPDDPIEVYPKDGGYLALVTLEVKPSAGDIPAGVPKRLVRKFAEHQFEPSRKPYFPVSRLATPPHFEFSFRQIDVDLPRLEKASRSDLAAMFEVRQIRGKLPTRSMGFTSAGLGMRGIGEEGVTLEFPLHRNAAELRITSADPKIDLGRELSVAVNGKPLAPLRRNATAAARWTTAVPATALVDGPQVLQITRKQSPVTITAVDVINPNYSVVDFLADAKRVNPMLEYVVHQNWMPARVYGLWIGGSVVLMGLVWPSIILLMARVGLANRPAAPEYDLSRFQSTPTHRQAIPPPAAAHDDELRRLEEEMERRLLADADTATAPTKVERSPETIKALNAETIAAPSASEQSAELKIFGGEYYPVVKKIERVEKKESE